MQGRPKGGKNKYYLKEEKIKIVQEMLRGKTTKDITNEYGINHSVSNKWLHLFNEYGEKGLENKKKPEISRIFKSRMTRSGGSDSKEAKKDLLEGKTRTI